MNDQVLSFRGPIDEKSRAVQRTTALARELLSTASMRNPLLLTSAITCLALSACGGSNESAKSANDSADRANDAAEKAEDRANKAEDKANDAANDANKAEKENEAK